MKIFLTTLLLVFFIGVQSVLSQDNTLDLDQIMTKDEQSKTGISKLSYTEKKALEIWLTNFALRVYQQAQNGNINSTGSSSSEIYANTGSGHWISKKLITESILNLRMVHFGK